MNRTDIINNLILNKDYKTYLEIGVRNPVDNFNKIVCYDKVGVDPDSNANATHVLTSDDFFKFNKKKFDIVFIDGLHLEEQVLKDIENSLDCLNEEGIIICHDCLPEKEQDQVEIPAPYTAWFGTVWKGIAQLRMTRVDLSIFTINTDCGCGIITKGTQNLYPKIDFKNLDWKFYNSNKINLMNVIEIDVFKEKFLD